MPLVDKSINVKEEKQSKQPKKQTPCSYLDVSFSQEDVLAGFEA